MRTFKNMRISIGVAVVLLISSCSIFENEKGITEKKHTLWVNGYLAAWQHNIGENTDNAPVKTEDIDWDAITHLTYYALAVDRNGTPLQSLNPASGAAFNSARLQAIVPAAHANETPILFAVGGLNNYAEFSTAIQENNRPRLINTITSIINNFNFDGVSLNLTPLEQTDYDNYWKFIIELRSTLDRLETINNEELLMTTATAVSDRSLNFFSFLQDQFDQINIMTYNMAQPFRGWQAWHSAALFNRNIRFEHSAELFPSINQIVSKALAEGIAANKLGIGINFYGYQWNDLHFMGKWEGWPSPDLSIIEQPDGIPFTELSSMYNLNEASWDDQAKVPYLNVEIPKAFISFENAESISRKVKYAHQKELGGVMIWELGGAHFPANLRSVQNPLLQAVKKSTEIN